MDMKVFDEEMESVCLKDDDRRISLDEYQMDEIHRAALLAAETVARFSHMTEKEALPSIETFLRNMVEHPEYEGDTFSERLRQIMYDRQISQYELARRVGISQPTISNYVSSKRVPNAANMRKISEVLGVSIDVLTGRWRTNERTCHVVPHGYCIANGEESSCRCWSCSECSYGWHVSDYDRQYRYCPNCGAKVVNTNEEGNQC